jgi:thiamine biosynthesis lipoprotein ApbE
MHPTLFQRLNISLLALLIFSNIFAEPPLRATAAKSKMYTTNFESVLGTSMELKVKAISSKKANEAEKRAIQTINNLNSILSGYDANSEFSKWLLTKDQKVKVSADFYKVLQLFDQWKYATNGALNASAETVNRLWKNAAIQQQLPSAQEINNAIQRAQEQHWLLNETNQTATHLTDVPLMLNTFVKSYIIEKAVQSAKSIDGVDAVLVNIGGDIVLSGNLEEKINITDPRSDAINDPFLTQIIVENKAIATSGNYRRGISINDQWYSHIVDPRTGFPSNQIISATVIANNATDAGALATAFNVLTPAESEALANTIPGVEYLIVTKNGEQIKSKGWYQYEISLPSTYIENTNKATQWNTEYELLVNLELAQQPGFARRPFVAIWVENENKESVRTLSVWYNKPKWLRDLKAWYNANNAKFNQESGNMPSIAGATRSAGKYTIKWDGKDDAGNYVNRGKYIINIEVAREHGTYQLISSEIKCNNSPVQVNLPENVEVAAASLDYRKKTQ